MATIKFSYNATIDLPEGRNAELMVGVLEDEVRFFVRNEIIKALRRKYPDLEAEVWE